MGESGAIGGFISWSGRTGAGEAPAQMFLSRKSIHEFDEGRPGVAQPMRSDGLRSEGNGSGAYRQRRNTPGDRGQQPGARPGFEDQRDRERDGKDRSEEDGL